MRPKVMLLDEITSALDPEVVGEVLNVIRSLNKEHDLNNDNGHTPNGLCKRNIRSCMFF